MSGDDHHRAESRPSLQAGAAPGAAGLSVLASIDAGRPRRRMRVRRPVLAIGAAVVVVGAAALAILHAPSGDADAPVPPPALAATPVAPVASVMPAAAPAPPAAAAVIENVAEPVAVATARAATGTLPATHATAAHAERREAHAAPSPASHASAAPLAGRHAEAVRSAAVPQKKTDAGSAITPGAFGPRRDNDVDLLEAMIAHGTRAARVPAARPVDDDAARR